MKTLTLQAVFIFTLLTLFSHSGNAQCAPEISGYTNLGLYKGHSYYLSTSNARPTDAQAAAEALGGYLVVINDADENDLLQNYINELTYIGFNDANTEGTLETFNGEPVTYTNIDPCGFCQSNDANNDYVVMEPWGNDGEWSFSNFYNQRKYIVEIPCGTSNNSSTCSFVTEWLDENYFTSSGNVTEAFENPNDYEVRFTSFIGGGQRRMITWKLDKLGNEIQTTDITFSFPSGMDIGRISTMGDYFFMHDLVGFNPQLNKYDFLGNTIFSKTYNVNTTISNITYAASRDAWEDEDGLLVTGHVGDGPDGLRQPFLIKTDLNGNEQWQVLLPTENKFVSLDVLDRSIDGGYYLRLSTGIGFAEKVIKIDNLGNVLWTHTTANNSNIVDREYLGESPDGSGFFYVQNDVGSTSDFGFLGYKLNPSTGAVVWEKEINDLFSISSADYGIVSRASTLSNDGGLLVDFIYLDGSIQSDKYGKIDGNGNLVWGYEKPKYNRNFSIPRLGTSDGGFLLIGNVSNDGRIATKITSDGSYAPICEGGNNNATLTVNCDFGFPSPFADSPIITIDPIQNPNGEVIQWDEPTGTTTCSGGVTVELINGFSSGSTFTVGNFDVLYRVSDACGNEQFCGLELRVRGPLSITTCTSDVTVNATNAAGAIVNYDLPTNEVPAGATCYYNPFSLYSGPSTASGSQFPIGTTEVEYIAYRSGSPSLCEYLGDYIFCRFNVTVLDNGTGGGCPQDITGFTTLGEFGDSKYYISNSNSRPVDAQAEAESFGGYLVSINSQAENDFIQQYANGLTYIGLTDENTEGNLEWFNGDPVSYNNINPCGFCNENSASQDYGVIQPWDGGWSFSNFYNSRKYIMEIPCGGTSDLPDLTVSNVTNLPSFGNVGQVVSFNFDLNNIGTVTAIGDYNINIYTSANTILDGNDILAGVVPTGGTSIGTIADVPASITVPAVVGGDYYLIIVADGLEDIAESNENNNTLVVPFGIGSGGGCPTSLSGFTALGEFGGSVFFLSNEVSRPTDAQNTASSNGGNLAVINSQGENDFLFNQINELVYIGINDAATENTLAWVDGSSVGYTNFDVCSFCNENESNYDYVVMHGWNGGWSWSSVWNQRKYIVEIPCLVPLTTPNVNNTLIAFPTNEMKKLTLDKLMPNPANDYIFASVRSPQDDDVEVHILDARGVLVKSEVVGVHEGSNTIELDIADLPSGFYMMQIPNAQTNHLMLRFVKQRD